MRKPGVRLIGSVALVAATWVVGSALAANLSTSSQTTGAGTSATTRCDNDGFSSIFELTSTDVSSVDVSDIASTCGSKTANVTVTNGTTTGSGSATIPAGGGSVTVTISPVVPVTLPNVLQTEITVT
jgi:hypothetical protein